MAELEPGPPAPAPEAAKWRQLVAEGRVERAMAAYLEASGGERDAAVWTALSGLKELQQALREGAYARAQRLLAGLEPAPGLLDWPALAAQLEALKEAAEQLGKREPERTLEALAGVREPVLLAEAETLSGTARIFLGEPEAAREAFGAALALDPKQYRAQTNLGNLELEDGRVDEAIALYQRALATNPEFANAHHNLGVAYRRKGQIGKSVGSLRKAQRAGQRKMREEARETLRKGMGSGLGKYGKWLLYAALAVAAYLVLRGLGMI